MKYTARIELIAIVSAAAMAAGIVNAADYYVAPDGNDNNPGTRAKPFKNPVVAAQKLGPGDTLYFRGGTYRCRTDRVIGLAPSRDGEKDKPITFRNYKNEHVKLDMSGTDWGLTNNGFSYIVFNGFEVFGSVNNNMKLSSHHGSAKQGTGHHVAILNCELHHSARENLFSRGTPNLVIENCHFHDSRRSHGMYLQVGCHNAVIRNCTSENNRGNSGIQLNATGGGITNVLVERCILRGNAQGFSQMGVIDSTFRHNVAYNNGFDGPRRSGMRELIMWTSRKDGTKCRGSLWENNTFVNTVPEGHKLSRLVRSKSGTSNITFRNNIFVCRGKRLFNLQSYEGFVFENNCLYNIGGGIQVEGAGKLKEFCKAKGLKESGTLTADPMFADISEGNLRLKEGSPCIDAGAKTDAETGVKGRAPDIGAYEYGSDIRIGCLLAWRKSNAD